MPIFEQVRQNITKVICTNLVSHKEILLDLLSPEKYENVQKHSFD